MANEWVLEEEPVSSKKSSNAPAPLRYAARAGEAAGGLPGNVLSGVLGLGNYATGGIIPTYEKVQEKLPISLPTSAQSRESLKKATGGYFEPESGQDGFWDNVVSDFASFITPTPFGKSKPILAAVNAIGGNVASESAKSLGFGQTGQAISKLAFNVGSMFPGSQKFFTHKYKQAYDSARESIPKGASVNASKIEDEISKVRRYANSGDTTTPAKTFLKDRIRSINVKINKDQIPGKYNLKNIDAEKLPNKIPVEEVWALKKDFNELLREENINKSSRKILQDLNGTLKETLNDYGKTNKAFGQQFEMAEDLYTGIHKASKVNKFFQDNLELKKILKNSFTKGLFGYGAVKIAGAPKAAAGLAIGSGLGQGIKSYELIKNSKHARSIYQDILKNSTVGNISAVSKDLHKLNKVADAWEKENPDAQDGWFIES